MKTSFLYTVLFCVLATIACPIAAGAQTTVQPAVTHALQTIKLKVSGITCSGDCKDIETVLAEMNGVVSSKHLGKPTATTAFQVTFNPAIVTEKELRKAVENTPGCESPDDRPYKVKKG